MRVVTFLLLGLVACGRQGDSEKCEQAVRNYATLMYWRNADKDIEKAPAEQRDKLRKDHLADFSAHMDKGVQTLVTQCVSANDTDTINCMIAAKTAEQAEKCAPRAETK
jgi:hypothetical protein